MEPQELGPYLLLRQLSENALCETYRAGLRSGEEVERVVLLFSFKSDLDTAIWIAETANAGRRAPSGLASPFLSPATDSGEVAGTAYLTYDYIPGRSLVTLLERSCARQAMVPLEHSLLITERIAQGLLAAWEHESRALHGFVVPHLVMLSNEGDVRILGMEVASRLRKLLTDNRVREEMGRYLAEEVVPEGQPATTDDVFSLGAILYELASGNTLPTAPEDGYEALIGQATTADGSPLPGAVADLLRGSLAPSPSRRDLKSWQAELSALLVSGEYDVSAFNLALFLHALFPDEIEELEPMDTGQPEPEIAVPATQIEPPSYELDEAAFLAVEALVEPHEEPHEEFHEELHEEPPFAIDEGVGQESHRNRNLGIAAGIAAVVLASFGIYALMGGSSDADAPSRESVSTAEIVPLTATDEAPSPQLEWALGAQAAPTEAVEEQPAGPTPEEIDQRVQELLRQQSADMNSSLRKERRDFEVQLAELQQQLDQAREAAAAQAVPSDSDSQSVTGEPDNPELAPSSAFESSKDRDSLSAWLTAARDSESEPAMSELASTPGDLPGSAGPLASPEGDDAEAEGAEQMADPTLSPASDLATSQVELATVAVPERDGLAERQTTTEPSTLRASQLPAPEPGAPAEDDSDAADTPSHPAEPEVRTGDVVSPGPDVVSPKKVTNPRPLYPIMARRLKREATVTLRILIDENGRVIEAERLSDEAGYGFDEAALKAARQTTWEPATRNGVRVKMWSTLRIAFKL